MHLVIVSPFPPTITGIGQYGYHVTRALAGSGVFSRLSVLAGASNWTDSPNHLGTTEIKYCWRPGQLNARSAILSEVKRLDPDLVWFNLGASVFGRSPLANLSGLLTPMFVNRLRIPIVVTLHELVELTDLRALNAPGGPFASWGARLLTGIATRADVVCLTMQRYADRLAARGVDCAHIPIGAYHEPELLDESGIQELLFFTTLAPFKGLELLLEAFPALCLEYPQIRLTVAGTEHARFPDYLQNLRARTNGMRGVRWLGQVAEDNVKDLFRRAQVVVLPYTASTGSSSVLVQAAAWGRAVVASDLNEIRALSIENDLQVQFFQNGNVESLRRAIRSLLDSPGRRRAQAVHNLQSMEQARPEKTRRLYLQAFNRALEKHGDSERIAIPNVDTGIA